MEIFTQYGNQLQGGWKTDSENLGFDSEKRLKTMGLTVKLCELRGLVMN